MTINKIQLIKDLRQLTSAGMADCKLALEESEYDISKAQDIVKARGLANVSRNSMKSASEGHIVIYQNNHTRATMIEVNAQTDFSSISPGFIEFCNLTEETLGELEDLHSFTGDLSKLSVNEMGRSLEDARQDLMASIKENIVVRRWAREEALGENRMVFSYLHSNNRLGVLLSMEAPKKEDLNDPFFLHFGNNVAMQIAAMNPLAISIDQISTEETEKQRGIFELQLKEEGKPKERWESIMIGKMRKWNTEISLLEQESVIEPKKSIRTIMEELSKNLGGEVKILNFVRFMLGDGVEKEVEDYGAEISKMTGIEASVPDCGKGTIEIGFNVPNATVIRTIN